MQNETNKTKSANRNFQLYINGIVHDWLRTLALLVIILVPLFLVLDYFTVPADKRPTFTVYRIITTGIAVVIFGLLKFTKPARASYAYGYALSIIVSVMIIQMTVDLGGFSSGYYAGLNLIIVAGNVLTPWQAIHSLINGSLTIILYVIFNLVVPQKFLPQFPGYGTGI